MNRPVAVDNLASLNELLRESERLPLLLFKHSESCGVSAEALDELEAHIAEGGAAVRYAVVTVQTHRELSNLVASRLGVRHETPQAILVRDGRAIWTASHVRVNAGELARAIAKATS